MSGKSLAVAQYILDLCKETKDPAVTPMQLLKLVYIAHGHMLGEKGVPLLDEEIQAWQYGPVVPTVYQAIRKYRSMPVKEVEGSSRWGGDFSETEKAIMKKTVKMYASFDGVTLSAATHRPGTPWSLTWGSSGMNSPIPNDLIEHFYKKNLSQAKYSSL